MISVSDYFSYSLEILISVSKGNSNIVTCQCRCNIIAIIPIGREKQAIKNKLNRDVVRFTTHIKPVLPQIRLLTVLNVDGKMPNSTFQLVVQQCCKTSCTLLLPILPKLMSLLFAVHKKPLREVEIAAICHDALQVIKKSGSCF